MERTVIAVGLIALFFAVAAQAQAPVPKPGPEHKKLEIWVGDWTSEGESKATPLGPAVKHSDKVSVRKILGGFFLESRAESNGVPQYFDIDGYDPVNKKYTWNFFISDGSFIVGTYTLEGKTEAYSGTVTSGDKQYKIRGTIVFAADLNSAIEKAELSFDGKTWMPVYEGKYIKAKSSSK